MPPQVTIGILEQDNQVYNIVADYIAAKNVPNALNTRIPNFDRFGLQKMFRQDKSLIITEVQTKPDG